VLAVDDHPINLEILEGLLEPEGFQITAVESAAEALSQLDQATNAKTPFALALLDFQMPGMDGKELATRIRNDARFNELRLIMLTSIDQALTSSERAELNISASITKPLRRSRLFDAINATFGHPDRKAPPVEATPLTDLAAERVAAARSFSPNTVVNAETGEYDAGQDYSRKLVSTTGRSLNILIVEDNAINQMVIDELLHDFGHTTVLAENGEQAIECVQQGNIDLV